MICDVTIVVLKSFEVNNLTLYIDDDQNNLRALLLAVDDDHVSNLCLSVCLSVYVCLCVTNLLLKVFSYFLSPVAI